MTAVGKSDETSRQRAASDDQPARLNDDDFVVPRELSWG